MVLNPRESFLKEYVPFERELSEDEKWLYEYFEKIAKEGKIKMEDFVDVYGDLAIKKDKDELKRAKNRYGDTERHEIATLLEWFLYDQIERSNWMGEEVVTYLASEYDDIKRGVDFILEFPVEDEEDGEEKFVRVAVDVTASEEAAVKKIEKMRDDLSGGRMAAVKYFESDGEDIKGEIRNLPKVVLGINREVWENIVSEVVSQIKEEKKSKQIIIGDFRKQLIESVRNQAGYWREVLEGNNKKEMAKRYEEVEKYFERMISEIDFAEEENKHLDNRVLGAIDKELEVLEEKK